MSRTVDERVVEMRFDNRQFERGAAETISTLTKLKNSLNLDGATKGLESIDEAAKKVDMSTLGSAVETVKVRFSALQVMAVTALQNITNSALNTGKRLVSALTIAPIKSGFQEYETQINAVQTILANTEHEGTTIQQVNRALDELNFYADKTIYNFTQMTRNIGTFTAAGVDLQTSVDSIKGIANLAAVSGSTSQQASTAMYQLSQALAAGRVSLMDWNSVVNAGMGGKVFQDALTRTSEMLGTGAKAAIEEYGSFRESLTKGKWLTTEVLTETLKQLAGAYDEADLIAQGFTEKQAKEIVKMAETAENAATKVKTFTQLWETLQESAQSGWTQTWEIIIGDFGEAKETLTEISDTVGGVIQAFSDARNSVLGEGLSSGWKQLLDAGIDDEAGFIEEIKKAGGKEFAKMADEAEDFSDALKKGLKTGTISAKTLETAVYNLGDKMAGMSEEELKAAGYTTDMVKKINELTKSLKNGDITMEEFVKKINRLSGRENIIKGIWNAVKGLVNALKPVGEAFREVFPATTGDRIYELTEKFLKFTEKISLGEKTAGKLKETFKGLFSAVDVVIQAFSAAFKLIKPVFNIFGEVVDIVLSLTSGIGKLITKFDLFIKSNETLQQIATVVASVLNKLGEALNFIKNKTIDGLNSMLEKLSSLLTETGVGAVKMKDGVTKSIDSIGETLANSKLVKFLERFWNIIKNIGEGILSIVKAVGEGVFGAISDISIDEFSSLLNSASVGAIAVGFKKLVDGISDGVGSLFGNIRDIVSIKDSITQLLNEVRDCMESYQKKLKSEILLNIAKSMAILAAALISIGTLDADQMSAALAAISVLFGAMMLFSHYFGNSKMVDSLLSMAHGVKTIKAFSAAIMGLIGIGATILILATALKLIATLDKDQIERGTLGIVALVGVIFLITKLMSKAELATKGVGKLIVLAGSLLIMAAAIKLVGEMDPNNLANIVMGLGALLGALVISINNVDGNISGAGSMFILASVLAAMSIALRILDGMKPESLINSVTALSVLMGALVVCVNQAKGSISGAGSLFILSAALITLSAALMLLDGMKPESLTNSVTALSVLMLALVVCIDNVDGNISGVGSLLIMTVAVGIIAVVFKLLADIELVKAGIAVGSIVIILATLVGCLALMNKMKGDGLASAASLFVMAAAVTAIAGAIKLLSGLKLEEAAIAVGALVGMLGALLIVGAIAGHFGGITVGLIALATACLALGAAVAMVGLGLSTFAAGIAALATIGAAGATACVAALEVIGKAIIGFIPSIVNAIGEGIVMVFETIADSAATIVDSIMAVIMSLLTVLVDYMPTIVDYLIQFVIKIFEGLTQRAPELVDAAVTFIVTLFASIVDAISNLETDIAEKALGGVLVLVAAIVGLNLISPLIAPAMAAVGKLALLIAEIGLIIVAFGALSQIPGVNDLLDDGTQLLAKIGYAIGDFIGSIIGGLGAGLTSGLPDIGQNLADFANNVQPFIEGVRAVDEQVLEGAKALAGAILVITASDFLSGILEWLSGGDSLVDFAKQLAPFGEGLVAFSNACSGMDTDLVNKAALAGKALAELANSLPNTGGIWSWFAGDEDMEDFSKQLEGLGKGISKFSKEVTGINAAKVSEAIAALQEALDMFKHYAGTFREGMISLGNDGLDGFCGVFSNSADTVNKAVSALIDNFNDAVSGQGKSISEEFTSALTNAVKAIRDKRSKFDRAGEYITDGLIVGIKSRKEKAYNAGYELGQMAVQGELDGQKSRSPSKLTIRAGKWLGEGLIIGMKNMSHSVYKSGQELGETSTTAMSSTISKIADIFGSDLDSQPTIRPIIDLSEVKSGADSINGMFSKAVELGPAVNAGIISTSMNRQNQNEGESAIVSAIRDLRKDVGNLENRSYNINGISYSQGDEVANAIETLVRAVRVEGRV